MSSTRSASTSPRRASASTRTSPSSCARSRRARSSATATRAWRSGPQPRGSFSGRLYMAAGSPASLDRAAESGLGLLRIGLRSWEEVAEQVRRHRASVRRGARPRAASDGHAHVRLRRSGRRAGSGARQAVRAGVPVERDRPLRARAGCRGGAARPSRRPSSGARPTRSSRRLRIWPRRREPAISPTRSVTRACRTRTRVSSMRLFAAEVAPRLREIPVP